MMYYTAPPETSQTLEQTRLLVESCCFLGGGRCFDVLALTSDQAIVSLEELDMNPTKRENDNNIGITSSGRSRAC